MVQLEQNSTMTYPSYDYEALDITLCDKVCQWLTTGWWFSLGAPVAFTNKTNHHDITTKLLKVELQHHKPTM